MWGDWMEHWLDAKIDGKISRCKHRKRDTFLRTDEPAVLTHDARYEQTFENTRGETSSI